MMPAQSRVEAGIWRVPGHAPVIEYSRPVLEAILTHVVEAYDSYLAGGYEVGGVLFGHREGSRIRIRDSRPLVIQPPRPSFVLAGEDERRLHELIGSAARDPELAGMEPVGWYHSHTRSEIFLSESDLEVYDRFFPEPWQVAMVLRPENDQPVRIGFFFREDDGFIRTDQTYSEFSVDPPVIPERVRRLPPWRFNEMGEVIEEPPPLPVEPVASAPVVIGDPPPVIQVSPGRTFPWLFLLLAMVAVAAATLSIVWLRTADPPIGFAIRPAGEDLMLTWDPAHPALKDAEKLTVRIRGAGSPRDVVLNSIQIRSGRLRVGPRSRRVETEIELPQIFGRIRKETAIFLAHPQYGEPPPELVEARRQETEALNRVEALQRTLGAEQERSGALEAAMKDLRARREQLRAGVRVEPPPKTVIPPPPPPEPALRTPTPAPATAARAASESGAATALRSGFTPSFTPPPPGGTMQPVVAAPVEQPVPAAEPTRPPQPILQPQPQPAAPLIAASKPPISTPPPSAAKPAAPLSGRIIWTGDLPRNGLLTIDGRRASRGFVNAELPGVPIRIGAYAADLTENGLKIRTGNPKYSAQPAVEPPSAENGWNRTSYVYDPDALRDVFVEQLPDQKDLRRIVLRAGGHRLSVIVIEWQVIPQ